MLPANLDYAAPATLGDAVTLLASQPGALVVAGTYRAVIDLKMRRIAPGLLVDLRKIRELYGISADGNGVHIGAMTTLRALVDDTIVQSDYAALAEAAEATGDAQAINMETVGASLTYDAANSDAAAALLALNATIHVVGADGERAVTAPEFFASGTAPGEIVTAVSLPAASGVSAYEKFKHPATLGAVCGVAVSVTLGADSRVQACAVAVTGATAHPTRLPGLESALMGQPLTQDTITQAASVAGAGLEFVTDLYASGDYREHLLQTLLKRALSRIG